MEQRGGKYRLTRTETMRLLDYAYKHKLIDEDEEDDYTLYDLEEYHYFVLVRGKKDGVLRLIGVNKGIIYEEKILGERSDVILEFDEEKRSINIHKLIETEASRS